MANDLTILETQLKPLAPHFAEVLPKSITPERLIRTVVVSVERLPALLNCNRQSLFNAAMSAAVLGLEVDGVTGQAFLIPFAGKAQLVVGYRGFNTLAARSGFTITAAVVREGDDFTYDLGEGWVRHKPLLGNKGRIIAAWAKATHTTQPAIVTVLGIDDILAVKAKSPGAKRGDSPWNDQAIGFPAMCEKTAKRRLSRSMPLNVMQLAARMDEALDEQGKSSWVDPHRGLVLDGEIVAEAEAPTAEQLIGPPGDAADKPAPASPSQGAGAGESMPFEDMAREAALRGRSVLRAFFTNATGEQKAKLRDMKAELDALCPKEAADG